MQRCKPTPVRECPSRIWRSVFLALVLVFSLLISIRPASAEVFDQDQVKAVFLFNLSHFIHWPAEDGSGENDTFTIIVYGDDQLSSHLEKVVKGEYINGRTVVVRRCQTLSELEQHPGDLLFVGDRQIGLWPQIRRMARRHRMLTVSDAEGFAIDGGIINLIISGRNIRIEINIDETKRNGFDISAKLLKLARIVRSGKDDR